MNLEVIKIQLFIKANRQMLVDADMKGKKFKDRVLEHSTVKAWSEQKLAGRNSGN